MWVVEFGSTQKVMTSREAGKDYMRNLVMAANIWEIRAGQLKTTIDFMDNAHKSTILINGIQAGEIWNSE